MSRKIKIYNIGKWMSLIGLILAGVLLLLFIATQIYYINYVPTNAQYVIQQNDDSGTESFREDLYLYEVKEDTYTVSVLDRGIVDLNNIVTVRYNPENPSQIANELLGYLFLSIGLTAGIIFEILLIIFVKLKNKAEAVKVEPTISYINI